MDTNEMKQKSPPSPRRISRQEERGQLKLLNDRLTEYMEKIRFVEEQNQKLRKELANSEKSKRLNETEYHILKKGFDGLKVQNKELAHANNQWMEYEKTQKVSEAVFHQQLQMFRENFNQERKAREEAQQQAYIQQQQIGRLKENLDREQLERSKVQNLLNRTENKIRNFTKTLDPKQREQGYKLLQSLRGNGENEMILRVLVQEGGPTLEPPEEAFPVQRAPQTALSSVVAAPSNVVDINRISPDILAMIIEKKDANDLQRDIKDPDAVADKAFEARLISSEDLATVMDKESPEEKTAALMDIMEKKPGSWEQEFHAVLSDL